jgi:hypothetical protein
MSFGLIASLLFALLVAALLCAGTVAAWLAGDGMEHRHQWKQEDDA